jgi:beta-N-acetylhexosaminidase
MPTDRCNARAGMAGLLLIFSLGGLRAQPDPSESIDRVIDSLSVEERIGRLLFIAFSGTTPTADLDAALHELRPGGVLFYSRNVGTEEQLRALTASARRGAYPPLIGIDEEGGFVTRMPDGVPQFPSAMALGATRSEALAFEQGREIAHCLRAAGFDVNFAPVLDVHSTREGSSLGTRAVSDDPAIVGSIGAAFIRGSTTGGVATVMKHYPGVGATADDMHHTTPRMKAGGIAPFRAGIRAGAPAIMTAHAIVESLDGKRPVSISPAWHDYLRRDLRFDGVIITDALQMAGLPKTQGIGRIAVEAILAGSDMVVVGWKPKERIEVRDALREAYRRGEISDARLRTSLRRIRAMHEDRTATSPSCGATDIERRVATAAATLLRRDGELLTNREDVLYVGVDGPLRRHFEQSVVLPHTIEHLPLFEDRIAAAAPRTIVGAAFNQQQAAVIRRAHELHPDARLLFISLATPYLVREVPTASVQLCMYGATDAQQEAALQILLARARTPGKLPIGVANLYPRGFGLAAPVRRQPRALPKTDSHARSR